MKILIKIVFLILPLSLSAEEIDLELKKIIDTAYQETPDLQILSALVERQEGKRIAARSNYLPNLDLKLDAFHGRSDDLNRAVDVAAEDRNWGARLEFVQFLYKGDAIESTYKKSKFLKRAAEYQVEYYKQNIKLKLTEIFYTYLYLKEKLALRNDFLFEITNYKNKIKKGKELGDFSDFDLSRAEILQTNLENEIPEIETSMDLTFNEFLSFLDFEDVKFLKENKLQSIFLRSLSSKLYNSHSKLLSQAKEQSLELQRFKELIAAAEQEVAAVESSNLPSVNFFANYSLDSDDQNYRESIDDFRVGLRATWRLFDGLETKGNVKAAQAELAQRKLQQKQFEYNLQKELFDNIARFNRSVKTIPNFKKILKRSKQSTGQIKLLYDGGEARHLDFVDVLQTEQLSKQNYLNAIRDNLIFKAKIERYIANN